MRSDVEAPARRPADSAPRDRAATREGLYLFGITRSRSWRSGASLQGEEVIRVRYRDMEALVRPVPYRIPDLDADRLAEHQRMVEGTMRKGTILPAPFGLVFRGRRAVIRFLEDQYIVLDEGLAFLDGHWELRLHIHADAGDPDAAELARHLYSELRRFARAAIPLPAEGDRVLSAAFLVERSAWIEFVERTDDLSADHEELTIDVTGPWPPYDFVRMLT